MTAEFYNRQGCLLERRENVSRLDIARKLGDWFMVAEDGDKIVFRDEESAE